MAPLPVQAPSGRARPLGPRDLFDEATSGDAVTVSTRTRFIELKSTKAGDPWAVLEGGWRGHRLRCVVFPTLWATVEQPAPGDAVIVCGQLRFREGQPAIWVQELTRISLT